MPHSAKELFKAAYLHNVRDTARSLHEFSEVAGTLQREGIAFVAIKGITAGEEVYGDPALYPMSDIDILIKREDVSQVAATMAKMGYLPEMEMDPFYLENYHQVCFSRAGAKPVEAHYRLGMKRYFEIPEDFWWEDLRERKHKGFTCKVLSAEKAVLFAGIHLFGHGYAPLKFIAGMSEMLRAYKDDLNWHQLIDDSRKFRVYKALMLSLYLAATLLDAPLPPEIAGLVRPRSLKERWIFKKIKDNVFERDARFSSVVFLSTVLQYDLLEVGKRMIKWIFPPLEEVAYRYDIPAKSGLVYLYYVLNPILLILKKRNL